MILRKRSVHFIGIGGAGMSPLAEVLFMNGFIVSGSDKQKNISVEHLIKQGINIQIGHKPKFVKNAEIVVYSSAVSDNNPEIVWARSHNLMVMKRAQMLSDIMRTKFSIAISGTHGKTTTTSLMGTIFSATKYDPTVLVGGTIGSSDSNALFGSGDMIITEADEYDRSFLRMYPQIAVITNVEEDHLDIYEDIFDIDNAFCDFAQRVPFYGFSVMCADDHGAMRIASRITSSIVTYGISENADYRAVSLRNRDGYSCFNVEYKGKKLGEIELPIPGNHNVLNALAAIAVAYELDVSYDIIISSLKTFVGVKRRFEIMGTVNGVTVIDDYAHHPTEVAAAIETARQVYSNVTVLFQPHLYSRTEDFCNEFANELSKADAVFITPIYKAREAVREDISGADIAMAINQKKDIICSYLDDDNCVVSIVCNVAKSAKNGCILLMGAGDINLFIDSIIKELGNG